MNKNIKAGLLTLLCILIFLGIIWLMVNFTKTIILVFALLMICVFIYLVFNIIKKDYLD